MGFFDKIKVFFNNDKTNQKKELICQEENINNNIVNFKDRDNLAIEISKSLYELYATMERENKKKIQFFLRIKDSISSKNCTISNVDLLIQRISERTTTIGYEFLVKWINGNEEFEEYNDINKILVKIYDGNDINIDYQYEIDYEIFNVVLEDIKNIIKNRFNKNVEINNIKRIKPIKQKEELVDFGILGNCDYYDIEYRTEEKLNDEQIEEKKREILNSYKIQIDDINKKIFYEMHYHLMQTDHKIWDYEGFDIIINREKLPVNFDDLSVTEKGEILYLNNVSEYNELWEKIKDEKPFWNLENIKKDINITNVVIEPDYNKICIEFNGFCSFFYAIIEMDLENYNIINFDVS